MNLLAIDTATDRFSVAVGQKGDSHPVTFPAAKSFDCNQKGDSHPITFPAAKSFDCNFGTWLFEADVGRRHSELSMDSIDMLLRRADLKPEDLGGVVCMGGPGSFTGLRIGFSLAKGLACALGIPYAAVPTLDCMAWPFSALPGIVMPVIDAKQGAYFCNLYQNGKRLYEDMDATPGEIAAVLTAAEPSTPNPQLPTITGPGAPLLYDKLCAMDLKGAVILGKDLRWGNAATLLHIARETDIFTRDNNGNGAENTAAGPEYIRKGVTAVLGGHKP